MGSEVATPKRGPLSTVTDDMLQKALEIASERERWTIREIASELGVSKSSLHRALSTRAGPVFTEMLQARADGTIEKLHNLSHAAHEYGIEKADPRMIDVAMKGLMWLAEHEDPKRYGRQETSSKPVGVAIQVVNYGKGEPQVSVEQGEG